ncbi:MAG: ABC transporter ATP-binding protein [Candidatus Absconditabacteria bacterium]
MIEINNISKSFGSFKAVDSLNLKINPGECFGLLGRNGAGKTTTIKMLVGLLKPDSGDILFDGLSIMNNSLQIKQELSYIPDSPYLYDKLTGMDFLFFVGYSFGMKKEEIKDKIKKYILLFDLEESINKKTEDYSHGMRQKLTFISALMHKPRYLIVDEPMVGLDPQSAKVVKDIIKIITKESGTSVILTTHQLHVAAQVCDRIGIIHSGKLQVMLEGKESFTDNLEDEFIRLTGGYEVGDLKNLLK